MAAVQNCEKLIAKLKKRAVANLPVSVIVGYTANYAVRVHEDLTAFHRVGQAKFLEQPARTFAKIIGQMVRDAMKRGMALADALLIGGLKLQRESQLLVPVDTGNLRASAFCRRSYGDS